MINTLIEIWMYSAFGLIASHLTIAFIIDRSITMGTWAKGALIVFSLLGPLGVVLETVLLFYVLKDIFKQMYTEKQLIRKKDFDNTRWQKKPGKFVNNHG